MRSEPAGPPRVYSAMSQWRVEILDDEAEPRLTLRDDVRRYGLLLLAFLMGWVLASVTPVRLPIP